LNPYRIVWMPRAAKDARRLGKAERHRLLTAIDRFAATLEGDVMKLTAVTPAEYRLRVGDWRVRFSRDDEAQTITILRVLPRDKAYRVRETIVDYGLEVVEA
jgi:mRNA-degrading endonuclease RelE of RelBE toxin-antitoxin system